MPALPYPSVGIRSVTSQEGTAERSLTCGSGMSMVPHVSDGKHLQRNSLPYPSGSSALPVPLPACPRPPAKPPPRRGIPVPFPPPLPSPSRHGRFSPMAQASSLVAVLRRRTPAAARLLPHRLVSSAPAPAFASSSLVPLPLPSLIEGDRCGGGLSASFGSHSRLRLPRRHHAVAMATRTAHQVASR